MLRPMWRTTRVMPAMTSATVRGYQPGRAAFHALRTCPGNMDQRGSPCGRWSTREFSTKAPRSARCENLQWEELPARQQVSTPRPRVVAWCGIGPERARPVRQAAASGLGWDATSWEEGVEHPKDDWADLTVEEHAMAIELGFTRKLWCGARPA
jgi:hypothetical protein